MNSLQFDFESRKFELEFQREYKEVPNPSSVSSEKTMRSRYPYTTARVLELLGEPDGKTYKVVYRNYTVGCSHLDRFSMEEGRRSALRMICRGNSLSKPFKKAMWKCYLDRGKMKGL